MFQLRKWYFDFLTPEEDYVFVYYATVRLGRLAMRSLTAHLARPGKGLLRTINIRLPSDAHPTANGDILRLPSGGILVSENGFHLSFGDEHNSVALRYVRGKCPELSPVIIPAGAKRSIVWKPLGLSYRVSGTATFGDEKIEVQEATGYIDYLESSCLPPLVPVRSLLWGRVARHDLGLVFMQAAAANMAKTWSSLSCSASGRSFNTERLMLKPAHTSNSSDPPKPGDSFAFDASSSGVTARLSVRHEKVVQHGAFIDQQQHTPLLVRKALKWLSRNPRSTKFLSWADILLDLPEFKEERNLPMISEFALL